MVKTSLVLVLLFALASPTRAQNPPSITLPTVVVTAQKEPADVQTIPASVTAVSGDTLTNAGVRIVSEAGVYSPNTWFSEFTARKLSNARFRGVGSSPANPGVTTYIDGVPQMNANTSSVEFLDVDQVEFVRGPQSPLFGRNTLGGVINITSRKPSLDKWNGSVVAPFGDFSSREVRASASGPINDMFGVGFAFGRQQRDGYSTNLITGNDVDYREGTFYKGQLLYKPAQNFEARLVVAGESDRDGDYALNDLASVRANPFQVARDYEGFTNRDVNSVSIAFRGDGDRFSFTSISGFVNWDTEDSTDLDYTPLSILRRNNTEDALQITQEVRVASAPNAPWQLTDTITMRWLAGSDFFQQSYNQLAVNTLAPFVLSPFVNVPVSITSPDADLGDYGVSGYGHATLIFNDKMDLTAGVRFDYENKSATLNSFYDPPIAPPTSLSENRGFTDVSPQFSLAYHFEQDRMAYVSANRGFKAGGYNPSSLPGNEAYNEEHAWHLEGGVKTAFAGNKATFNAAVFYIDWDDMQLNVPNPFVPGQFFIDNVGAATSGGVELELVARPHPSIDVFGTFGYANATFSDGSMSGSTDLSGNTIPNTPLYTAVIGTQVNRPINSTWSIYGRAEAVFYGDMQYDDANTAGQDAYSLANFRGGVRGRWVFGEFWVRNAFDTLYVPIAFPYQNFAPSGFVGEPGRPRTFGVSIGVTF